MLLLLCGYGGVVLQVYGIEWKTTLNEYSVYDEWLNTDEQRLEMITSDEVKRIQRCCVK